MGKLANTIQKQKDSLFTERVPGVFRNSSYELGEKTYVSYHALLYKTNLVLGPRAGFQNSSIKFLRPLVCFLFWPWNDCFDSWSCNTCFELLG